MKLNLIKHLLRIGLLSVASHSHAQFVEPSQVSICEFGRAEALTESTIKRATIVHVSSVEIATAQENRVLGAVVGGAVGGLASKNSDFGSRLAVTAIGTAVGTKVADHVGKTPGIRFLVEDSDKVIVSIVAARDACASAMGVGSRVFIAKSSSWPQKVRIIRE
jgi:outer membrane lipoprotein SlyB